jgi:hypothetical protein
VLLRGRIASLRQSLVRFGGNLPEATEERYISLIRWSGTLAALFLCSCTATKIVAPQTIPIAQSVVGSSATPAPAIFVGLRYGNVGNYVQEVLVFNRMANGNVAPLQRLVGFFLDNGAVTRTREFFPGGSPMGLYTADGVLATAIAPAYVSTTDTVGIDKFGDFYQTTGATLYSNYCGFGGDVTLRKYAPRSGGRRLMRVIDLGTPCYVTAVAVDDSGNTYVGEEHGSFSGPYGPVLAVYGPYDNGPEPTRSITLSHQDQLLYGLRAFGVDRSGDIFAQIDDHVVRYPKGYPPRVPVADTGDGGVFDVDDAGYVYVLRPIFASNFSKVLRFTIRVYAPGKRVPVRVIAGNKTLLRVNSYASGTIGVAPQR